MFHIFHFLQAVNYFSRIFIAISSEKRCLISKRFLLTYNDVRTIRFFPPAESWLVYMQISGSSAVRKGGTDRWTNTRNMLRATMLWYFALKCCNRLAGASTPPTLCWEIWKRRFLILWKSIKCFLSTRRLTNLKHAIITGHLGFVMIENSLREITWVHRLRKSPVFKIFSSVHT